MTNEELAGCLAMELFADAAGVADAEAAWKSASDASHRVCLASARRLLPLVLRFAAEQLHDAADYEDTNGSTLACARLHERGEELSRAAR